MNPTSRILVLAAIVVGAMVACRGPLPEANPTETSPAAALILYDWTEDKIANLFDDFTQEYGIQVRYQVYETQEEAIANIRAGEVYDVVVMDGQLLPGMIDEGLLAPIDHGAVPNLRNISPNFRDLVYDPRNAHSVPYSWGTTGLLVRTDLVTETITSWADVWDPRYAGRVALWESTPRYTLGMALKSLGYSANSEDPAELEAAIERLIELKPQAHWLREELSVAPLLTSGQAVIAMGWAEDVWLAQEENEAVSYVLPREGSLLWGDNFVIPANSSHRQEAGLFINFLLRPEVTGQLVNENYYAMPNDAATPFIEPEILSDPVVYAPNEALQGAEILLPLSLAGQRLWAEIWDRFLAAQPGGAE